VTLDIVVSVIWGVAMAGAGAFLTDLTPWYRTLKKPSWQPPDWLFGPAWTVILGLASWSLYLSLQAGVGLWPIGILFGVNAVANVAWSPLFFKLGRPDWALIEVPFLWFSVLAPILVLWPFSHLASLLFVPYLAWVSFAGFLNWTVVRLNGPFEGMTARA
jgi:tryptophan-rich sensory protein